MNEPTPITVGSSWETRDGAAGLAPRRTLIVTKIEIGHYQIPKGSSAWFPPDEISFTFDDGRQSSTTASAFRRTYVPLA